jgi:FkbM family methyltransferase
MKEWRGIFLPDNEQHLIENLLRTGHERAGKPVYQSQKYNTALSCFNKRNVAVDIGANLGLWSRIMGLDFEKVHSFEPVPEYIECFKKNAPQANVELHEIALGSKSGKISLAKRAGAQSCGDTGPSTKEKGETIVAQNVTMKTLDSFELEGVDFIKVDCEGYELDVLKGAEETILRCKPCIIVEQKPGHAQRYGHEETEAVDYLESLGMKLYVELSGDFIFKFND